MIFVTFGHERGSGFEAFIKSFTLLTKEEQSQFQLIANSITIKNYLNDLKVDHHSDDEHFYFWSTKLKYTAPVDNVTISTDSLISALESISNDDILLTLPTSKDQLILDGVQLNGHTEFFRKYFNSSSITMNFLNEKESIMLLTDHIPLKKVPDISIKEIIAKVEVTIKQSEKFSRIVIAGINPHAGENGLIGKEDSKIKEAVAILQDKNKDIEISGPIPGDALHYYNEDRTLKVFTAHDQGLSYFKGLYGIYGANVTFGLPFIRLSVDHGTAFDLYAKNLINYSGSFYTLKRALKFQKQS